MPFSNPFSDLANRVAEGLGITEFSVKNLLLEDVEGRSRLLIRDVRIEMSVQNTVVERSVMHHSTTAIGDFARKSYIESFTQGLPRITLSGRISTGSVATPSITGLVGSVVEGVGDRFPKKELALMNSLLTNGESGGGYRCHNEELATFEIHNLFFLSLRFPPAPSFSRPFVAQARGVSDDAEDLTLSQGL